MLQVSRTISRPRVQYNPSGYKRARKKYDEGDPRELIQMMSEAAVDSHVQGCLMGRRSGYKRPFTLTSYDDKEADEARRDWMHGVLQRLQLRDLFDAIHEGRQFIYNVIDFEWDVVDGYQVPIEFEAFEQHHFRYDKEGVLKIDAPGRLVEIPDTALVVEQRKMPLMLPVLRDWLLKEFGLEGWAAFLETWGEPFLMAKYPAGAGDEFKKEVQDALDRMAASARGMAPEGTSLDIHEAARRTGDHDMFVDRADKGISITLLGHENAASNSGGLQIGDHPDTYEVRWGVAEDDMYWIEPWMNRLIRMIWDRNIDDGRYPQFEFSKSRPVNAKQHTEIVRDWHGMGLMIHPDEARKAGLYVYEDQEPLVRTSNDLSRLFD